MPKPLDVIVVDDEPKICELLEQILIARGCVVRTANDGLEALSLYQAQPAEVIITDIRMPKLTGLELMRELKRLDPLINVVVITAYPSIEGAVEAMQYGACDFITKPFELAQIQAILYRCQQRLSLTRQLRHTGEGLLKLEELNRRLVELNDMKSRFLAALSHEVNTPLCLMSEWIYLLSERTLGPLTDDQGHAMDVLIKAYERLHVLLQQLLDVMHGHEIVLTRQTLTLQDLLRQAIDTVAQKAEARRVTIVCSMAEAPLRLDVDRQRCTSAFAYLLDNAVKFNHDEGRVEVELSATPDIVSLRIRDTGIGIPDAELEKVFQPFYQVDQRLNRTYEGAGIGLSLAKRYIELHGGTIRLTSKVGEGTTIFVALPRTAAVAALSGPQASPQS